MKTVQSSSRGRGGRGGGGRGGGGGRDDSRFASRYTDPRFKLSGRVGQKPKRRLSPQDQLAEAAKSDPRFAKLVQDKEWSEEEADEEDEDAHMDDEEADSSEGGEDDAEMEHSGSDLASADEEEEAEEELDDSDDDDEVNAWAQDEVEYTEATARVAIVNCDWDHVRAVDLYAILFNALPLGGQLKDVCVYMSDFGKRMIEHERTSGPDLWVKPGEPDVAIEEVVVPGAPVGGEFDEGDDGEAAAEGDDAWVNDDPAMLNEHGEDGEYFSGGKYRKYEMDRMRYYYAVATFDSADTAAAIYNELDGMDIEASGVTLDLRYIDDEDTFEEPVSRADAIPSRFKPLGSFTSAALTNTRFRISWDQDDVFRHQSVQDSFTGTTEEDDLAAYLAPPDSDDDDTRDSRTGRTKAEEKARVRRKYASLLEEIGGLAEDGDDGEGSLSASSASDSDGGSDDDSLNRFSDVEMDSDDEEEEGSDDDDDESEVMGDMEGTLDLDAGTKAQHLQRAARLKQKLKGGDLAAKAEVKYKQRRKEMKKAKKEMKLEERDAKREALAASRDEQRRKLKVLIGTDDDGATHLSGKERRKQHAKEVKQRLAEERVARKQMRVANQLGITREAKESIASKEAEAALGAIDPRFQSKLLSDPRFHLEVATKDKRIAGDVQELAATVAKARRGKRANEEASPAARQQQQQRGAASSPADVDSAVDYFLSKPAAKKQRRR